MKALPLKTLAMTVAAGLALAACATATPYQPAGLNGQRGGYAEGIALGSNGLLSEGAGENLFLVKRGRLLTPPTSPIAALSGLTEESYYLFLTAGRRLDADSDIGLSGYVNYLDSGVPGMGDAKSAGISTYYSRRFWRGLSGTAAASLDAFDRSRIA